MIESKPSNITELESLLERLTMSSHPLHAQVGSYFSSCNSIFGLLIEEIKSLRLYGATEVSPEEHKKLIEVSKEQSEKIDDLLSERAELRTDPTKTHISGRQGVVDLSNKYHQLLCQEGNRLSLKLKKFLEQESTLLKRNTREVELPLLRSTISEEIIMDKYLKTKRLYIQEMLEAVLEINEDKALHVDIADDLRKMVTHLKSELEVASGQDHSVDAIWKIAERMNYKKSKLPNVSPELSSAVIDFCCSCEQILERIHATDPPGALWKTPAGTRYDPAAHEITPSSYDPGDADSEEDRFVDYTIWPGYRIGKEIILKSVVQLSPLGNS